MPCWLYTHPHQGTCSVCLSHTSPFPLQFMPVAELQHPGRCLSDAQRVILHTKGCFLLHHHLSLYICLYYFGVYQFACYKSCWSDLPYNLLIGMPHNKMTSLHLSLTDGFWFCYCLAPLPGADRICLLFSRPNQASDAISLVVRTHTVQHDVFLHVICRQLALFALF